MKKNLWTLGASLLLCCACQPNDNLQGDLSGVESDTVLVYKINALTYNWIGVDTVALEDGHFSLNIADSVPIHLSMDAKHKYGEKKGQILYQNFLFFPGDHMSIQGNPPYNLTAKGTAIYDLLASDAEYMKLSAEIASLDQQMDCLAEDDERLDTLEKASDLKQKELNKTMLRFVRTHPDSEAAAYLCLSLEEEEGLEAIARLSEKVRKGRMRPWLDETEAYCKESLALKDIRQQLQPGVTAPDFQLKDAKGKTVSLADFRGKYVVLDFWGTWCGWCLAGVPKMKTYYEKYAQQVEFVGICCADQKDRWLKCLKQRQMNWTNLFQEETEKVAYHYGVDGYPTKIILDKEGTIIAVFEGESQEFYDQLDELFHQ